MNEPASTEAFRPAPTFTGLPSEIRQQIYSYLLVSPQPLRVEVAQTPHHRRPFSPPSTPTPLSAATTPTTTQIKPHQLTSQLLRVSRLIYTETHPLLYSLNNYDVGARSSLHALTTTIPPHLFQLITTLTLDWDSLQDFSFQLAKPHFLALLTSLTTLALANWRTRVQHSQSAFLWRDVQAYERTLCAAALLITERSPRLRIVAQRGWLRQLGGRSRDVVRRNLLRAAAAAAQEVEHAIPPSQLAAGEGSLPTTSTTAAAAGGVQHGPGSSSSSAAAVTGGHPAPEQQLTTMRVKWRFLASAAQLSEGEELVDIRAEVSALTTAKGASGQDDGGPVQMALDPI